VVANAWHRVLRLLAETTLWSQVCEPELLQELDVVEAQSTIHDVDWYLIHLVLDDQSKAGKVCPYIRQAIKHRLRMTDAGSQDTFIILFANITVWRKDVSVWLQNRSVELALLQETHVSSATEEQMRIDQGSKGWKVHSIPGVPGVGHGIKGGLATLAKKHRDASHLFTFSQEGCGFIATGVRLKGWHLAVVNVYLRDSTGLGAPPNSSIVSALQGFVRSLSFPWIIAGDFNIEPEELQATNLLEMLGGRLLCTDEPTLDQGGRLDFAIARKSMESLVSISAEWDVPWKPHACLSLTVRADLSNTRMPQLTRFRPIPEKPQGSYTAAKPVTPRSLLQEEPAADPLSTMLAGLSQAVEAFWFDRNDGRGCNVPVVFAPLVPRSLPGFVWGGRSQAFWGRMLSWSRALDRHQHPGVKALLLKHFPSIPEHWTGDEQDCKSFMCGFADELELETPAWHKLALVAEAQEKLHKTQASKASTDNYKDWLTQGLQGSMKPLFKTVRKHEAVTCRPFLDRELRVRPFLRRDYWHDIWCPGGLTCPEAQLQRLTDKGRRHALVISPIKASDLQACCERLPKKMGGPAGWEYGMLGHLPPEAYADLAKLYADVEQAARLPAQMTVSMYAMLPETWEAERPIGLCHVLWRLWCKLRWGEVTNWLQDYLRVASWDEARPGCSCLEVALRRLLSAEQAKGNGKCLETLFVDLRQFYERVDHGAMIRAGQEMHFPDLLLCLATQLYRGSRYIDGEGSLSPPVRAERGLMAGCPLAPILAKLAIHKPMALVTSETCVSNSDTWIDDISLDVFHVSPAQAAAGALKAYRVLKKSLAAEGLEISETKTSFVCSDSRTATFLKGMLAEGEPQVKQLSKDLGVATVPLGAAAPL
jgi:hypothetical protein